MPQIIQTARQDWLNAPARNRYAPLTLTAAQITSVRALFDPILARYGVDTSASAPRLPISRAVRDAIARLLMHPSPPLHPDGSTGGLQSLPAGVTMAQFNAAMNLTTNGQNKAVVDNQWFNDNINLDGWKMLQHFFGTNFDGADGTLTRVEAGRWRIFTITPGAAREYRAPQCSWQHAAAFVVLRAYDIHSTMCSTVGHDGKMDYLPEIGGWTWQDCTYNEEIVLDGGVRPLSPMELHTLSVAGQTGRLTGVGIAGPDYDPAPYLVHVRATDSTYFNTTGNHPNGMNVIGSMMGVGGNIGLPVSQQRARHVQVWSAGLQTDPTYGGNPAGYPRVMPEVAFPDLGVGVSEYTEVGREVATQAVTISLAQTVPGQLRRRVNSGAWQNWSNAGDTIPAGTGTVEYGVPGGMSAIVRV